MFGKHRLIISVTILSFILMHINADSITAATMRILSKQNKQNSSQLSDSNQTSDLNKSELSTSKKIQKQAEVLRSGNSSNHSSSLKQASHISGQMNSNSFFLVNF